MRCLRFSFQDGAGGVEHRCFANPVAVIEAQRLDQVRDALRRAEEWSQAGYHVAGFVSYEAAHAFDAALVTRDATDFPLVWFGVYDSFSDQVPPDVDGSVGQKAAPAPWQYSEESAKFAEHVEEVRQRIAAGDVYQVNYTLRLSGPCAPDLEAWCATLRSTSCAGYTADLSTGRWRVLSLSPELFFRTCCGRITMRPMKGTIGRGATVEEDERLRRRLADSVKDRAENVMIVDLLRNDLGRIARTGSVRVEELFTLETYPTVHQMTSTISAQLLDGVGLEQIFAALFPCGSVTGAPKVAAMQQIARLESAARGVYCGAIGYLAPSGDGVFNVAIRTLTVDRTDGRGQYGVGGGVTWDSTGEAEWAEVLAKSRVLAGHGAAPGLFETLRLDGGCYWLLERHIARLVASVHHFSLAVTEQAVRTALSEFAEKRAGASLRVRVTVEPTGHLRVEGEPLDLSAGASAGPVRVALARTPVYSADPALRHKTTDRTVYEQRRGECPGAFDVLLFNERDELTEFTIGNLVLELDGRRYTPASGSGLLPGTFRAALLASGEIEERVLHVSDVARADRIWLINSVRGWVAVTL